MKCELVDFSQFIAPLKLVAENSCSASIESDQARELIRHSTMLVATYQDIWDRSALNGKTVGEAQTESLRLRMTNFLFATRDRWDAVSVVG